MIRVYPSKLEGEPIETYAIKRRVTLEAWWIDNVPSYRRLDAPLFSVSVNGKLIKPSEWGRQIITPTDTVDIVPEPGEPITLTSALIYGAIAIAAAVLVVALMPKPNTGKSGGKSRGDALNEASVRGNQVKLNAPIREVAGRRRVYPDYLLPPHRRFVTNRDQQVRLLLCFGKGKMDIPPGRLLIGDTPIISLGEGARYTIYPPGASLAGEVCAEWWHSVSEVGATATGSAGLELTATSPVATEPSASTFIFSQDTITIPDGAGSFPEDWAPGMIARIVAPQPYTVVDGGADHDVITGNFDSLAPFPGMVVEVAGDFEGTFVVDSFENGELKLNYPNGAPADQLQIGTFNLSVGYAGLRYRIVAASTSAIVVERLTDTGATDPQPWPGFPDFTSATATIELDTSNTEGDWTGPFMACPPNEVTSTIAWDNMFPGGLTGVDKKGRKFPVAVTIETQYRDANTAGAWSSVRHTYSAARVDQLGYTKSILLPYPMRPEVRQRRIGAKSDSTQIVDSVEWYGLRSKLDAPTVYEGVTVMALEVTGGKRLAAEAEQMVSGEVTRVLPVRTGEGRWDVETPTRDIVPFMAHVARSLGYADTDLDFTELDRLNEIWVARGDRFDMSYDSATTAKQVLTDALRVGFADMTLERGKLSAARDEPRSVFQQMYTPQNMTVALERDFIAHKPDDFDGVDVEYVDSRTWQVETIECRLPGDEGRKVEKLTLEGVTNATRAWRIGMRQRRGHKYRRKTFTWGTELDGLNSPYMAYCAVSDDVPGYGQSALLMGTTTGNGLVLLETSEPFDWSQEGRHVVALRKPNGDLSGPWPATRIDDFRLTVPALDFTPDTSWQIEPPHLLFGISTRWCYRVLITDIDPRGSSSVTLSAVNYDERIYASDNAFPPVA